MKWTINFLSALFLLVSTSAFSQNIQIGVVDLQKIMQTSKQMKELQQKLEQNFQPRRAKLMATEEELKNDMVKLKRDSAVLSQAQKKDLEKKVIAKQQALERDGQQYQQELTAAQNDAMEDFYNKIRQAINKIAEKEKYDIVLQKEAAPFISDKLDITSQVIKQIG